MNTITLKLDKINVTQVIILSKQSSKSESDKLQLSKQKCCTQSIFQLKA